MECQARVIECDNCEKTVVQKVIGEKEIDGGFSKYPIYEDSDEYKSFEHVHVLGTHFNLCARCYNEYVKLIQNSFPTLYKKHMEVWKS